MAVYHGVTVVNYVKIWDSIGLALYTKVFAVLTMVVHMVHSIVYHTLPWFT